MTIFNVSFYDVPPIVELVSRRISDDPGRAVEVVLNNVVRASWAPGGSVGDLEVIDAQEAVKVAERAIGFGCLSRCAAVGTLFVDDSAAVILGVEAGAMDRDSFLERVCEDDRRDLEGILRGESGWPVYRAEYRVLGSDGTVRSVVEDGRWSADGGSGRKAIAVVRSAAEKNGDTELRRRMKLEAVGMLAAGAIHDLNNIFVILQGSLEMLHGSLRGDPRLHRMVVLSQDALHRASSLTRSVMGFVRTNPDVRPQRIDVARCLQDSKPLFRALVPPSMRFELDVQSAGTAEVCRFQLESAVLNLVANARDASTASGEIRVILKRVDDGGRQWVRVSVTDRGSGVPKEIADRLFEPFFTTKPLGKGTGLGLSNVKSFAEGAGGRIELRSEQGKGTEVSIFLPAVE